MQLSHQQITEFQSTVLNYYRTHGRHDLPWRQYATGPLDPYKVLVSEVMLQQTQVARVITKFNEFMLHFPSLEVLAQASLAEVLTHWSGLGYNRRARYLHLAAQTIHGEWGGLIPNTVESFATLPGIGKNTAAAIVVYSYNQPLSFIETNIRTVYLYHFFTDDYAVADSELLPLIEATLSAANPREWYWALMDYGTFLKRTVPNPNRRSKHYTKQSRFEGSKRQIRGVILRLLKEQTLSHKELAAVVKDPRLGSVLRDLQNEGLIHEAKGVISLG